MLALTGPKFRALKVKDQGQKVPKISQNSQKIPYVNIRCNFKQFHPSQNSADLLLTCTPYTLCGLKIFQILKMDKLRCNKHYFFNTHLFDGSKINKGF